MTNPTKLLRSPYGEVPFNYEVGWNDFLTVPVMKLLRLEQSFLVQR
ncbi:hypothetical protein GTQ43_17610 [Nostoc sp. KVJ3]|nr:hypothetical protein [Nostoc sp. KVJ3]MCW5315560.1 hypothetical protein [Nostoc sp. KVJ3]